MLVPSIALSSNFQDYYDEFFCPPGVPHTYAFNRLPLHPKLEPRTQFKDLEVIGFNTPANGQVQELARHLNRDRESTSVVVYFERHKELMPLHHALADFPHHYASAFIATTDDPLKSKLIRFLRVGKRGFWLKYEAEGGWNVKQAPKISVSVENQHGSLHEDLDLSSLNAYPLFAIDFVVPVGGDRLLAINFDPAPKIAGTGVEDLLSAQRCFEAIAEVVLFHPVYPPAQVSASSFLG